LALDEVVVMVAPRIGPRDQSIQKPRLTRFEGNAAMASQESQDGQDGHYQTNGRYRYKVILVYKFSS
jgi:hypothetical protein